VAVQVGVLTYDPEAFDKAGIAYPSEKWSLADFVSVVNKLSLKDSNGKVTVPAFAQGNGPVTQAMLRSLVGENLFDPDGTAAIPQIDKPSAESLLDAWSKLDQQGMLSGAPATAPMSIAPVALLSILQPKRGGVLLPGGKAALLVNAFAVSAGTQYPEQAYALAKFLTTRGELANATSVSARKSLADYVPS